jgi:hypothetical protein
MKEKLPVASCQLPVKEGGEREQALSRFSTSASFTGNWQLTTGNFFPSFTGN